MSLLSNRFYLKLETGTVHGGSRILAATHLPRVFSLADAMELAAELIKLAGGLQAFEPYAVDAGLIKMPVLAAADQVEPNVAMLQAAGSSTADAQLEPLGSGNGQANAAGDPPNPDPAPAAADPQSAPAASDSPAAETPAAR